MSDNGLFMERLMQKKEKEAQQKAFKEAQERVEEVLMKAVAYDEAVKKNPVKYVNLLLDDFVDFRVDLMELVEFFDRCPNTPYIFHAKKIVQHVLDKYKG